MYGYASCGLFLISDIHKPQCYGVYGCFPINYPWKTDTRLVSLYPESPLKINPRYPVFHKNARVIPHFLDLNEPYDTQNAGINPQGNIFFIAHGYLESGDRPWVCSHLHFKTICSYQFVSFILKYRFKI